MGSKTMFSHRQCPGFSLLELLVVIAILAVLLGLVAQFSGSLITSADLSNTAGEVGSALNRAREDAHARNVSVQVRFYKDPEDDDNYNMVGIGIIEPPTDPDDANYDKPELFPFRQIANKYRLPPSIIMMSQSPYSTLITGHSDADYNILTGTENDQVKGVLAFSAVSFSPDNRAELSNDKEWTLTFVNRPATGTIDSLPDNFITLQVHPATGKVSLLQP